MDPELRTALENLHQLAKAKEVNLVVALFTYSPTHFSTVISLPGSEALQDHAILDAFRELSVEWSNARHDGKLVWEEPAK